MKAVTTLLRFTAEAPFEQADRIYIACKEAPIVGCGATEEEAFEDLLKGLRLSVDQLEARGELDRALVEGHIPYARIEANTGWSVQGIGPLDPVPPEGLGWLLPAGMHMFGRGLQPAGV